MLKNRADGIGNSRHGKGKTNIRRGGGGRKGGRRNRNVFKVKLKEGRRSRKEWKSRNGEGWERRRGRGK